MESVFRTSVYVPGEPLVLDAALHKLIEVQICAKYITTSSPEIQGSWIWGTDVYTQESDPVAILCHSGKFPVRAVAPAGIVGVSAVFRVVEHKGGFPGSMRNMKSKSWFGGYFGFGLVLVRVTVLDKSLAAQFENVRVEHAPLTLPNVSVPVCFNSTNNPWLEYSPFLFTDCFSKWETCDLYWESPAGQRYCLDSNWVLNKVTPVLEHFSEEEQPVAKKPRSRKQTEAAHSTHGVFAVEKYTKEKQVLKFDTLKWEDVSFESNGVKIGKDIFEIKCFFFIPRE